MILAHIELNEVISFKKSVIVEWIVESPTLFRQYIEELYGQINGKAGRFVLSCNDKELDISKFAEIIFEPFTIELNEKKFLTKIYNQLQLIANDENMYIRTREMVNVLQQYFLEIEQQYDTTLVIEDDIDLQGMFKLLGVKIETDSLDRFEKLVQYIKLHTVLLNKKLIVLVNARCYLTEEQIAELLLFSQHNEINLLFYESYQRDFTNSIKRYIIDKDQCEI